MGIFDLFLRLDLAYYEMEERTILMTKKYCTKNIYENKKKIILHITKKLHLEK